MKIKFIFILVIVIALSIFWLGKKTIISGQYSKKVHQIEKNTDLKPYDMANIYREIKAKCNEMSCFEKELQSFIPLYGPTASLELLEKLQNDNSIDLSIDDHQIAHRIGRKTAKIFGPNGRSFLLCPTLYNYGCQHGFFEHVLGQTSSTKEAAEIICGSIENDTSFSSKFKFYCYHGLGHGVLMAQAYDLYSSLSTCDSLPTGTGREGCWQGVFMENVNGGMKGEARSNIFSKTDPLAPCNDVNEKYRHQCFINHAGWLMRFFHNNVTRASRSCLKAPTANVGACLESIGLMVTNLSWQQALLPNSKNNKSEYISKEICDQFPESKKQYCIAGAVDNIMNFNELNISEATEFCNVIDPIYKTICYKRIGSSLINQTIDKNMVIEKCSILEDGLKNACMTGAGLN